MELSVTFSEPTEMNLPVEFAETDAMTDADFGAIQVVHTDAQTYSGDYVVTPKVKAQTLSTKQKVMLDDVTIKEVPVYRVSNNSGGTTVYIAREV